MADNYVEVYVGTTKFTLKGKWVSGYTFDFTDPDTNETTTVTGYDEHDVTETDNGVHVSKVDGNTSNPDTDKTNWETWVDLTAMVEAKAAETKRQAAEDLRVSEEKARQSRFTTLVAEAKTATDAANNAATDATAKATKASDAAASAQNKIDEMETLAKQIAAGSVGMPTEMKLEYLSDISVRNEVAQKIGVILIPSYYPQNAMFQKKDGDSLDVDPGGNLKINGTGKTSIYVIPTNNTSLWKEIEIVVRNPELRLSASSELRMSNGALRIV